MRRPRLRYTPEELADAVQKVLGGANGKHVSLYTKIPYNTLMRIVRQTKAGTNKAPQRRGPKPVLPAECESDWCSGLLRCSKTDIRRTAMTFPQRHPELTERSAQVISHSRNFVDMDGVNRLFESMKTVVADHALTPDHIFKMDETAFSSRKKSKKVIALKGSQNVFRCHVHDLQDGCVEGVD
ncbi:hypothetical protein B5M09_011209 [Aphanomyces astaci]|uniref:HTH psq-type domain-containing protein n=1 Tax=Aphanomyces astaci TaxID=112090 RepID=A0A3R7ZI99_APHAT|nr:hypothetical protein B5M09_011209 [Aphanomyces astaci]